MSNPFFALRDNKLLRGAIAATLFLVSSAHASAEEINLHFVDGSAVVSGALIAFLNGHYYLETTLGTFVISETFARCEGAACPIFLNDAPLQGVNQLMHATSKAPTS